MLEQSFSEICSPERAAMTVQTMVEVDPTIRPSRTRPRSSVRAPQGRGRAAHARQGLRFKPDGNKWRRVVASPEPKRVFELRAIKLLLERNTIVIAAGGGGIPTMYEKTADRKLAGVECVIDKDLASALLRARASALICS